MIITLRILPINYEVSEILMEKKHPVMKEYLEFKARKI